MPTEYNPEDDEPKGWPTLPSPLWNHMAMAIESVPSDHMFFFGGQKAPRGTSPARGASPDERRGRVAAAGPAAAAAGAQHRRLTAADGG